MSPSRCRRGVAEADSDVHTTLASGRDTAAALRLVALLHVQGTQARLRDLGPLDLAWQSPLLSQQGG
jgi:hypothetical protein